MEITQEENKEILDGAEDGRRTRGWWGELGRWGKAGVVVLILFFLTLFYITLDANKYRATVHVIEGEGKVGINPTDEVLDFGDLSPGTSAVRRVAIENSTPIPVYVAVVRLGSITDLMKLDKSSFVVKGRESTKVEFTVYMPASAPVDATLDGKVFIFKIPGPWK